MIDEDTKVIETFAAWQIYGIIAHVLVSCHHVSVRLPLDVSEVRQHPNNDLIDYESGNEEDLLDLYRAELAVQRFLRRKHKIKECAFPRIIRVLILLP